jgi:hypothetical protein
MIINKNVIVKPNNHSINHYLGKGYNARCRKEILVKVEDLTLSSMVKVNCKCDECGKITNIRYQDYIKCINKYYFYVCNKCKFEKIKITNKEKYGNENYINVEKIKETMNFLYDCDSPLQNKNIKKKKEKTCIKKYGFKTASKNKKVKEKIRNSHIKIFENDDLKNEIINKRKKTCMKKYGFDNYTKTENYKIKTEETCMRKYGFKHTGSVPRFILKRRLTRIKNNNIERTNFYLYKRKVLNITRKNFKILIENWNGYDYYDQEFIKNNFNLKPNSSLYPSVDHKISTYYGYINNIEPEIIGHIDNLCFTKKSINSSKKHKTEEQYKKKDGI